MTTTATQQGTESSPRTRTVQPSPGRRWLALVLCLAAGLVGGALSFDFGLRAGGPALAVMAALLGGAFSSMVADALVSPAAPRHRRQG